MKVGLDFTNVKSGGSVRVPEGDYIVKVKKVEKTNSKASNNPMLVFTFQFLTGGSGVEGKEIKDRHILTEASLWTLRNMLEAMGYNVPASKMNFTDKMVMGRKVGISVIDGDEYKGRIKSEVADYISPNVVGNLASSDEAEYPGDTDAGDDDDGFLADEDDSEDEETDLVEDDEDSEDDEESDEDDSEEDDDSFSFDDDDEEDEEEEDVALSFDSDDVESAKAAELKAFYTEATEAGFEFDLPKKPKAAEVREALLSIFADEDEEDDDEMEDFDLDDVE